MDDLVESRYTKIADCHQGFSFIRRPALINSLRLDNKSRFRRKCTLWLLLSYALEKPGSAGFATKSGSRALGRTYIGVERDPMPIHRQWYVNDFKCR